MAKVTIGRDGDLERALKKFKMRCNREGIFKELKERKYYMKPSIKKRNSRERKNKFF